ncbi:hypothetical protein [Amphiplicatus metriothermophilus]|uniref:Uncharacterized protein n=1 Tax=Amphiplicatus metriothermophilus TaxID=1519374 RepID=A0A239PYM2_9PROT|nr:hypothetical protein [Amphiplicatus metriothermophilus]MBB5519873.1 hypothetical protein [Amphiplicatus metriothermophilus]SNT75076.1 hypothetical protein SAMN06297382_2518 [Amphiplicatus metriothermophilus]
MKYLTPRLAGAAACALACAGASAYAHSPVGGAESGALAHLAEEANLVFRGRVAKVEYRLSEPTDEEPGLPHAIVTYRVSKTYRGKTEADTFSMRFIGGPDGMGGFLDLSGVPFFEEGEEDILFVRHAGQEGCPLVLCEYGRFRVYQGGVYNTHGSPVRAIIDDNAIARGRPLEEFLRVSFPAPTFDGLMRNPEARDLLKQMDLTEEEARRRYEQEAPKTIQLIAAFPEPSAESGADAETEAPDRPIIRDPRLRRLDDVKPQREGALRRQQPGQPQIQPESTAPVRIDPSIAARQALSRPALAIAQGEREIPEGPLAVEEFEAAVARVIEKTQRAPAEIRPIDLDAPFTARPFVLLQPQAIESPPPRIERDANKQEQEELRLFNQKDGDPVIRR